MVIPIVWLWLDLLGYLLFWCRYWINRGEKNEIRTFAGFGISGDYESHWICFNVE